MDILKTNNSALLNKALQIYNNQHEAIAENVANVNNKDFKKNKTDFSDMLSEQEVKSKVKTNHAKHISVSNYDNSITATGNSEDNNIDLTEEMTHLTENQIRHEFVTRMLNRYYNGISTAITGNLK